MKDKDKDKDKDSVGKYTDRQRPERLRVKQTCDIKNSIDPKDKAGHNINKKLHHRAVFGVERFPPSYQGLVGQEAREDLHKNSEELVSILKRENKLTDGMKIFEMGSGPGRNLYYIWKENKTVSVASNDLFEAAVLEHMHPDLKKVITFFQGDSEDVFKECRVKDLDLLLISDHLMHLQYIKADNILNYVLDLWKPKNILLREIKEQYEAVAHPRLYHNYSKLLDDYRLIFKKSSDQDEHYFIWLLERK
jgi:hypothetical protein